MHRVIVGLVLIVLTFGAFPASAEIASLDEAMSPKTMGDPKAPVTIHEFASLTCPHCADFTVHTLPQLKKAYIDTGKVYFVYTDFPFDQYAAAGAMVARCAGNDRYFGMIDMLFRSQAKWTRSHNPLDELTRLAGFAGLDKKDVRECLNNEALYKAVQKEQHDAQVKYGIDATPTFIINGKKYEGDRSFDEMKTLIDKALQAKQGG